MTNIELENRKPNGEEFPELADVNGNREESRSGGTGGSDGDGASDGAEPSEGAAEASAGEEAEPNGPPLDVVFDILRNRRRRLVLAALREKEGTTTLSEMAEHIGGIENDKPPSALNAQERKRVYVGLYQCHLPRMDDANAIDFDSDRGTIEIGENAEIFYTYLKRDGKSEPEWYRYYGGLAAVSCLGVLGTLLWASGLTTTVVSATLLIFAGVSAGYLVGTSSNKSYISKYRNFFE